MNTQNHEAVTPATGIPKMLDVPPPTARREPLSEVDVGPAATVAAAPIAGGFLGNDGQAYVQELIGQRIETMLVGSSAHRRRLALSIARARGKSPRREELDAMIAAAEASAQDSGVSRSTWRRVAVENGKYYLDLCTPAGDVVEMTRHGWRIVQNPDVCFLRPNTARPLPLPVPGGKVEDLRRFVNVGDEHFPLVLAFMLQAWRPAGPYPVLALFGEQGSAKSTSTRVLRNLIDPAQPDLRALPRCERDLFIAAANSWLLPFDNLSGISGVMSDALCIMSTSGAFATRRLYSDNEEHVVQACRPVILNGIEELVTRSDLLSRTLLVPLPTIPAGSRRDETEFWAAFEAERPKLLGALLDAFVAGLAGLDNVKLPRKPRMADFATWGAACAPSLGVSVEQFLAALEDQEQEARSLAFDADPVAQAVVKLMNQSPTWLGPATELLEKLRTCLSEPMARQLPANAAALTNRLNRSVGVLRGLNIEIRSVRVGHGGSRRVQLRRIVPEASSTVPPGEPANNPGEPGVSTTPEAGSAPQSPPPQGVIPPEPQDQSWLR